jgi:hypothetical protein
VTFSNFVTNLTNGLASAANVQQGDTVRVIFNQGATGNFGVTMPTGNAAIKYANGVSTIGVTANSVTLVDIQAVNLTGNASTAGATTYLVNISPAYS